jgi:hypothetical protein
MTGQATYHNMRFIGWKSATRSCSGARQKITGPWPGNSDYVAFAEFKSPTFEAVTQDAVAFIYPPSQGWINWEDCGIEFTCTGLYNVVIRFEDAKSVGTPTPLLPSTFEITSNNAESISVHAFKDAGSFCQERPAWNAW